jgi:peptide/nickel transport system substrate-binding protein
MRGESDKSGSSTPKLLVAVLIAASMVCVACVTNSSQAETTEDVVLRIGFMQKVDSLNPFVGMSDASYVLYGLVYDCLQAVDEDLGPTANLALGWGIDGDYEPYGSVWGFNLTENARWHDGTPLTADDVVFTVNLNADYYSQMWAYQPYTFFMDYAEKVDEKTVRIHFYDRSTAEPMPVAYASSLFFPIMPRHMLQSMTPSDIGFNWEGVFDDSDPPIIGTGPFMATEDIYLEYLQGDKLTLVRNPDYHWTLDRSMEVRFDRIEMHFFDDATAMALALEMGDLDVAQFPPKEYLVIKGKVQDELLQDIETYDGPKCTQYWTNLLINMNNAGPNPSRLDPVIRQAMAMATDKTFIVDNYYLGLADEGSTLIPPVNTEWHYELAVEEVYEFNNDAAIALLEAGGYRYTVESPSVRVCTADSYAVQEGLVVEGTKLVYDMAVRQEYPEEKDIAQYLESEWAKIGIEINYRIMTEPALGAYVYSYAYDTAIWYWSSDPDPNYILFCQSKYAWSGWNDNLYSTPEYEENYAASIQALDPSERKGYVDECQRIYYRDVAYIIFACPYQTYAWRTDNIEYWGDWAENPGMSIDAYWGGNPFYFEYIEDDVYAPVTTAEVAGTQGENGWYTSNVTVTLDGQIVYIDTKPPVTTAAVSGTSGDNGWYVSEVTVTFEVADASGEVDSTWYSLDSAPWEEYVVDIAIDSDGVHTLGYYSIDGYGNVENERTRNINIDTADPYVIISLEDGTEFETSNVVIEFDCDDNLSGIHRCEYSLDGGGYESCNETEVHLFAAENGEHTIVVRVFDEAGNSGSDSLVFVVNAFIPTAHRSVDYVWGDMFSHPFGPWYEWRTLYYSDEMALTDEYPYLYLCSGMPPGNDWIYSFMRLNITGRDMTELSMNGNPEFLPYFGTARGGNAEIDWHMDYATYDECVGKLGPSSLAYYDGWYIILNGTMTLDTQAAMAVLGAAPGNLENAAEFDSWWLLNEDSIKQDWEAWMAYEADNDRLAIFNMYGYPLEFVYFFMEAEMVGDEIVLTMDTISWGMEALMTRWLNEVFMPTELYMEDMDLHATIGPYMADVDIDAAVAYSLHAYESMLDGTPCWAWEAMLQDYVESSLPYPSSAFDPYVDLMYINRAPGSDWYGEEVSYDYTPGAWNLSENETLTFEWPAGEQLFIVHDPEGTGDGLIDNTANLTANMTVRYAMPMPFDNPDVVEIDPDQRQITFTGPFDMWTWSQEQTAHEWLMDEWERLDVLPFGIPYIEFTADIESDPLEMQMDGPPSAVLVGEAVAFIVTVVNSTSEEVYTDYDGTVTFMSSDPAAVLPADYTFVPGVDAGSHEFAVTFTTIAGYDDPHWLTVHDISSSYLMAAADDIAVLFSASVHVSSLGDILMATAPPTINTTMYRIDDGSWLEYVSPFVISDEGVHVVNFYSVDSVGTIEETNGITVKIDKTAPALTFVTANGTEFDNSSVRIAWNCTDGCSGIDGAEYSLDGAAYVACNAESYVDLVDLDNGTHTLSVRVCDDAGNIAEDDIQFDVVVTVQDDDDDDTDQPKSLALWQVAGIITAVAVVLALAAMFALRRRRPSPPGGDDVPPPDDHGPAEPPD